MLSSLHHPNLVNLIGYCADGDQRLLVYEYMPLGSLEDRLHGMPFEYYSLDGLKSLYKFAFFFLQTYHLVNKLLTGTPG